MGGARGRPGPRLRRGAARGSRRAGHPGRHQLLRRPAAAAGDRPGAGPPARASTSSTTRSRRSTWPPTPGCGRRCKPETRDATVVIVAQRVTTISDADLILVLEDGRVVGRGTHHELLDDVRDVPGDRHLPADGGGGGMSTDHHAPRSKEFKATERIEAPQGGPGRGPMGGGMVGQKAMDFVPVRQAAGRPDAPRPRQGDRWWCCSASSASSLMSIGPRILGHATDLVFNGFIGQQIPPGTPESQWPEAVQGQDVVPGQGVDFAAVGDVLLLVLAIYAGASLLGWLQGFVLNTRRAEHRPPDARGRRGRRSTGCRSATSTARRAASCSAGSPTTSTTSARPCSRR